MSQYKHLSYEEQLELFKKRGISFDEKYYEKSLKDVSTIGYYQLKNYSYPFYDIENKKYNSVSFKDIIERYYHDKRFKSAVLHIIEDIEVTLNTRIAYLLGDKYGPFGYLNFKLWCQQEGKNKYLKHIKNIDMYVLIKEQNKFCQLILSKGLKSASKDVRQYNVNHSNTQPYLPIWLLMNELTLGESIYLFKLMNKTNKKIISETFNCTIDELVSWLECINLVRNICCHNGNLIDLTLKTTPKIPEDFKKYIYRYQDKNNARQFSNKIALVICILLRLMKEINEKYSFKELKNSLNKLLPDTDSLRTFGFDNLKSVNEFFESL
ncbi:Abi family protein [Lactobacillus psittaci]|uniref:Abortive infection bacteriophage resistance protein n=1 Tax=Lactobacillus psittaci DSM 15354 TaxID=1122152 RepID=A0A0R1S3U7_9LACO|nr:Abi family protein [Lactobacillus psittaci]KRL62260.1 hypothetical protein FC23_GL000345 [Lactobacillus psittaci DSM 15354]